MPRAVTYGFFGFWPGAGRVQWPTGCLLLDCSEAFRRGILLRLWSGPRREMTVGVPRGIVDARVILSGSALAARLDEVEPCRVIAW